MKGELDEKSEIRTNKAVCRVSDKRIDCYDDWSWSRHFFWNTEMQINRADTLINADGSIEIEPLDKENEELEIKEVEYVPTIISVPRSKEKLEGVS
jgi:hypothetical protein